MLPTVKNIQNFLAFNNRKGMYMDEIRKHDRPEPKQQTKQISLWDVVNLNVSLSQRVRFVASSSFINDLKEYLEPNMLACMLVYVL